MYKDSIIWISVTAIFATEGIRAYITKDSVKLLNKQDKIYTARSVSYLQEITALPLDSCFIAGYPDRQPCFY